MIQQEPSRNLAGCRVLVVEDEFFIADDLHLALVGCGAEVLGPVPSCEDALEIIAVAQPLDFAVLDINLSGELAFPVADALAAAGIPFVFATGYEQMIVPERFRQVRRWEKPFDPMALARSLPSPC